MLPIFYNPTDPSCMPWLKIKKKRLASQVSPPIMRHGESKAGDREIVNLTNYYQEEFDSWSRLLINIITRIITPYRSFYM